MRALFLTTSLLIAILVPGQEYDMEDVIWKDGLAWVDDEIVDGVIIQYNDDGKATELEWYDDGIFTGKRRLRPNGHGTIWIQEKWDGDERDWQLIYPDDWVEDTPLFVEQIDDPVFKDWLRRFKGALYSGDKDMVLPFFADTMDYGKYNCNEYIEWEDEQGNYHYACTRDGLIGSYSYQDFNWFAGELLRHLEYGIGPEYTWMWNSSEEHVDSYTNMYFSDETLAGLFFGYEMSIVTQNTKIYSEPTIDSEVVAEVSESHMNIRYVDIGCVEYDEENEICWMEFEEDGIHGYIDAGHFMQGTYYLKMRFTKINGEWKCSAIFQPPGC